MTPVIVMVASTFHTDAFFMGLMQFPAVASRYVGQNKGKNTGKYASGGGWYNYEGQWQPPGGGRHRTRKRGGVQVRHAQQAVELVQQQAHVTETLATAMLKMADSVNTMVNRG